MAGIYNYYCTMIDLTFLQLLLLSAAFATILKIVEAVESHSQAFIQTDNELRYLMDGYSMVLQETMSGGSSSISFTDVDDDNLHMYASPIRFEPPSLDFREHSIGMPFTEKVAVINPSTDTSVHMLSISGSTTDFHCSFFVDKSIPPGGNTTFDVVFLGRHEGQVEDTLFIHTSLGSFKYQVKASGIPNPYRLKSFLGVKMPVNSSYSPLIQMHNPYSSTLQVTEMYSSGGDLHLELPSGDLEASKEIWEIPPFETKSVIRASFVGRVENNHTAYIRIKTNSSQNDNLILPMEVQVSSAPGIYSPIESLDFGVMRSQDGIKTLPLNLYNYGQKHIHIQNIILTPVNDAVSINFQPIKIPTGTLHPTTVATVSFDPAKAIHPKQQFGKIVVKSKNMQFKLTIPYQATVLHGSLLFNATNTKFYLQPNASQQVLSRKLTVTNSFNVSIIIYNFQLLGELSSFMTVEKFEPVVIPADGTVHLLELDVVLLEARPISSFLRLYTNVSYFDLPVQCYDGKLEKYVLPSLDETKLYVGTLGTKEKREVYFVLLNKNPVNIFLKSFKSNLTNTFVELVAVEKGNLTDVTQKKLNFSGLPKSLYLKPNHYVAFKVGIQSPDVEGVSYGEVAVETEFEVIRLPLIFWTVRGSLSTDLLLFEKAFPGKVSWASLYVFSNFSNSLSVTSVEPIPSDDRFYFDSMKTTEPYLKPGQKNFIGKMFFAPSRECQDLCYTSLPVDSPVGQKWLSGLSMPSNVGKIDSELFTTLRKRWENIHEEGKNRLNITFQLDTNKLKGFHLKAEAHLQWPHLANKQKIMFPLTQIGNTSIREFALENPSGLPIIAQVLTLSMYTVPNAIFKVFQPRLSDQVMDTFNNELKDVFTLQDTEDYNSNPGNPISSYRQSIKEFFHVQPLNTSIALLLTPGMRVHFRIGFSPKDISLQSSLILIRNNLTILDAVIVQGQGGFGQMKFGNKNPDNPSPLLFDMLEKKHFKDCSKTKITDENPPNFTVRRTFLARNTGELPIYIRGFAINESPCEGYGFKILNCHGFELPVNSSKKIHIAFTPDFTISRVQRTLNIFTSLSPLGMVLNYSLVATIPPHLMLKCMNVIPRPKWERSLMVILLFMLISIMICVMLTAYVEGNRIISYNLIPVVTSLFQSAEEYEKSKILDLKNLILPNEDAKSNVDTNKISEHVNTKKHRSTSQSNMCTNILTLSPNLFKSKRLNNWSAAKPAIERQLYKEKDLCNNNSLHAKDMESESEHSINYKNSNRKRAKRLSGSDVGSCESNSSDKNQIRKGWQNFFNSSSENTKKPSESVNNKLNNICNSKENKDSNFVNNDQDLSSEKSSKSKVKSKSKPLPKGDVADVKVTKNKIHDIAEDDASSTTTESSSTDCDVSEKMNKLLDVKGLTKNSNQKTVKNLNKTKDNRHTAKNPTLKNEEEDFDDGEFELSTKSKAHRRIKVDHTKVFGGDILRPNTLELPYRLKTVTNAKEEKDTKEIIHPNKTSKIMNTSKIKGTVQPQSQESEKNEKSMESSQPQWDQPKPFLNSDDAFSEIARQTELFAQKHMIALDSQPNSVSTKGTLGHSQDVSISNSKSTILKHPGTIGERFNSPTPTAVNTFEGDLLSPGTPQTPVEPVSQFLPHGLLQDTPLMQGDENLEFNKSLNKGFSFNDQEPFSIKNLWDPPLDWPGDGSNGTQTQWNSFGMDSNLSNLWDADYKNGINVWPPSLNSTYYPNHNDVVDSLFGANSSSWGNLWPVEEDDTYESRQSDPKSSKLLNPISPVSHPSSSSSLSSSPLGNSTNATNEHHSVKNCSSSFDPFRSPHQIWRPTPKAPGAQPEETNTGWNFLKKS